YEARLRQAIAGGRLTTADVQEWLREVEGWGDQHAYAFDVPADQIEAARDQATFSERVRAAGFGDLLNAEIPINPADVLALATIRHSVDGITLLWVRGNAALIRRKELDYQDEIEGDAIEFHAYEQRWSRVAARFEW